MIADGEYVPDLKNISDGQLFALIAAKDDLAHAAYRVLYDRKLQKECILLGMSVC